MLEGVNLEVVLPAAEPGVLVFIPGAELGRLVTLLGFGVASGDFLLSGGLRECV